MSHRKPEPIGGRKSPNICPVCGKASYSVGGIHPQCSVKKADLERAKELKESQAKAGKDKENSPKAKQQGRWQKSCPKCKTSLHVRKKECDCGHSFAVN